MNQATEVAALDVIQKFLTLYRYIRHYGREMHSEGVRGRELSTLRYLKEAGALTVSQICDYLFISVSSTSEMISRMEEAGYVARRRSTKDCRRVFVELTPEGHRLADETPLGGIPLLRERIKQLPPERLQVIDDAFVDLLTIMEIDTHEC